MANRYVEAELLMAIWKLGSDNERLPTSHGILDRALFECRDDLPAALRDNLHFGQTNVGLRCYELPDILLAAQDALLTSEPNPTYLSTNVMIDEEMARRIAVRNGLSTKVAREIGGRLNHRAAMLRDTTENTSHFAA
ncbi:hypothetical protein [Rhizobium sp. TRM95796]|uniref:hypothetical protein n=1 Tax=Rhizobium sp. TRM95796 TaxID=2979862 RepID=UPI0021E91252|nr:hypothetical protein [Rhizobium sp. TRM95796]MCV3768214.1 hypothetical protein [Rhizobium sp. TRM95796]